MPFQNLQRHKNLQDYRLKQLWNSIENYLREKIEVKQSLKLKKKLIMMDAHFKTCRPDSWWRGINLDQKFMATKNAYTNAHDSWTTCKSPLKKNNHSVI